MEIKFEIDNNKVQNFTDGAKNRLSLQAQKYTEDVINEAEKVEELLRENGASPEITENIVFQAIRRNRTPIKHRRKWGITIIKILSELLLFISGLMFNQEALSTNIVYFSVFSLVFISALIITIIMHVKDGD